MSSRFPPPLPPLNSAAILKSHGLRADKSLGQNFLQDPIALQRIVDVAQVLPTDTVLEIGPGLGALTRHLAAAAGRVVAVELDGRLIPALEESVAGFSNIHIIEGDILNIEIAHILHTEAYLVVANIPYYITSALLRHLLESTPRPRRMVLTVQKEVADRICAGPGDMSLLALSVQVYGQPQSIAKISAGAFHPAPNVDSAVVRIDLFREPLIPYDLLDAFFALAKSGFRQKRKKLRNSLSTGAGKTNKKEIERVLTEVGISPDRRAETLSLQEWQMLTARMNT
ncbi:MAG: Ribosomal RNA small subunit methyltransferase A [Anaerolineales bacterium]|nr:Ribosomal RNA small subunit methyltransferase A [Anaerolineales bacterium]